MSAIATESSCYEALPQDARRTAERLSGCLRRGDCGNPQDLPLPKALDLIGTVPRSELEDQAVAETKRRQSTIAVYSGLLPTD